MFHSLWVNLSLSVVLLCGVAVASEHELTTAKVIDQQVTSSNGGTYSMPMGVNHVYLPLTRTTSRLFVETATVRMSWVELGNKLLIVPVGGEIKFYEDHDKFIVLDKHGKKHKFGLIGLEKKPEEAQK